MILDLVEWNYKHKARALFFCTEKEKKDEVNIYTMRSN